MDTMGVFFAGTCDAASQNTVKTMSFSPHIEVTPSPPNKEEGNTLIVLQLLFNTLTVAEFTVPPVPSSSSVQGICKYAVMQVVPRTANVTSRGVLQLYT
jgi:hypothetical protein